MKLTGVLAVLVQLTTNYDCVKIGYKKKSYRLKTDLFYDFKRKCGYWENTAKRKGVAFDLDPEFLLGLYRQQNKRCYYSGEKIVKNVGTFGMNSISLDRRDPNKGYTKDNVVFCSYAINSFKNIRTEGEFKEYLRRVMPLLMEYANK